MIQTPLSRTAVTPPPSVSRDLLVSLLCLGLIVVFVLASLALDGNWGKGLRVGTAASAYVCVLLALLKAGDKVATARPRLPFWPFAVAATIAELASGWLRTGVDASV